MRFFFLDVLDCILLSKQIHLITFHWKLYLYFAKNFTIYLFYFAQKLTEMLVPLRTAGPPVLLP